MYKLRNTAFLIVFMAVKVQGVYAQEAELSKNNIEIPQVIQNFDPKALNEAVFVNPYDYGRDKKVIEQMLKYQAELEEQRRIAEEERKKLEEEENKRKQTLVLAKYQKYVDARTDFSDIYARAGQVYGIHPMLLKAVHIVETGASGSTTRSSYAGAQGPMQFMPATFRAYGVDGNGDGIADISNVDDAIFSAAHYLSANGGSYDLRRALWHYNHSNAYIDKVLGIAYALGM